MKIIAQNLTQGCNTMTWKCPRDSQLTWRHQSCMSATNVGHCEQCWDIWTKFATQLNLHGGIYQIHLSWKFNMAAAAILSFKKVC